MCAAGLWFFVNRTKTGRGMQAVSQDPDTARLMGINVDRIIVVAFAVGATLAAVAGVAQGLQVTNINFRMGFLAGLKAFTAAVLGGIGNVWGAVVGGLTLGIVEAMAVAVHPGHLRWQPVEGRLGVRPPHPRPGLPTPGHPRREGGGPGMSKLTFSDDVADRTGPRRPRGWPSPAASLMVLSGLLSVVLRRPHPRRHRRSASTRPASRLYAMLFGVLAVILGVLLLRRPPWMSPARGLRILGITALVFLVWVLGSIAYQTGGLVNLNEGGWVALVGRRAHHRGRPPLPRRRHRRAARGPG